MTPRWERSLDAPVMEGQLFMDAVLRPHRSLSLKTFRAMLLVVIAINVVIGVVFALPLIFFWLTGRTTRKLLPHLLVLFALGDSVTYFVAPSEMATKAPRYVSATTKKRRSMLTDASAAITNHTRT
mgnify:CR=1 FL=1